MDQRRSTGNLAWVQLTVPRIAAGLLETACQKAMNDVESDAEYGIYEDLRDYFAEANEYPHAFAPTGTMVNRLKIRNRRIDGVRRNDGTLQDGTPRGTTPRRKRRVSRHERRIAAAKERRANRAKDAAIFNATRAEREREAAVAGVGAEPVIGR